MTTKISVEEMEAARNRTSSLIHNTPIMKSDKINDKVGAKVLFKCEHLQKTGSFKARGALNSAILAKEQNAKGVNCERKTPVAKIAHSSGNHGQALAWAAQKIGLPCTIVVPKNAPNSKVEGMKEYNADVVFCEPTMSSREITCAEMAEKLGYYYVDPHNCVTMINGHGSIVFEVLEQAGDEIDSIFLSVGGGGFAASVAFLIGNLNPDIAVYLVEPEEKNLANLLENGVQCASETLNTIADGVRVSHVGSLCEPILKKYCTRTVVSVKEEEIKEALNLIWTRTKQRIEPTAALAFAGVLYHKPDHVKKPLVILCGGNVDTDYVIN
ncbi:Protein CBG12517 [Caenorhabditis briggsae]|uniref:Serine racemase n=1 Tax=Caenorhabditis briggsae TaxID=6238 RepID=A8XFY4_CAEBR|nr:Protein CBG12517 [Caenorhabditis briggsae]CAP31488.2 Protein CBG12517 [Caenorhabditis briggsae]